MLLHREAADLLETLVSVACLAAMDSTAAEVYLAPRVLRGAWELLDVKAPLVYQENPENPVFQYVIVMTSCLG